MIYDIGKRSTSYIKWKRETKLKSSSKTYINEIVPAFPRAACQKTNSCAKRSYT